MNLTPSTEVKNFYKRTNNVTVVDCLKGTPFLQFYSLKIKQLHRVAQTTLVVLIECKKSASINGQTKKGVVKKISQIIRDHCRLKARHLLQSCDTVFGGRMGAEKVLYTPGT